MNTAFLVFKNMNFTKLFLASFASRMGTIIGMTAFTFYLLDRFSNQPFYATLTEIMYSAPTLLVFFVVGVIADKMDRQRIAYKSDFICAFLSAILMLAIFIGWMPLVFLILFIRSAVSKFFFPAEQALVQGILTDDEYTTAAGLNQMVAGLFNILGSAIGISFYWSVGMTGAVLVDGLSFVISAWLIHSCMMTDNVRLPNGSHRLTDLKVQLILNDFKEGIQYILGYKLLRTLILGFLMIGIVNGGFSVLPVYVLKYKLAPGSYEMWSVWMGIIFGICMLIGSFIGAVISKKIKLYHGIILGIALSGLLTATAAFCTRPMSFMVLAGCIALCLPLVNIALGGWLPKIVDPKLMGRVESWISPIMMLSHTLMLGFISIGFQTFISIEGLFILEGLIMLFVAIFYLFTLPRYAHMIRSSDEWNESNPYKQYSQV
ncbi:MFS transporter [Tuberibacillus sp. Marseille-P3662]|uniref:MFS transporter n=1 Tax=Tuberibacillus sp. Marseille-P3662 TaxID=1965358 RepID=UPI000A1CECC5|nr:MFS transporter [Tuberibacillus sp. Marseille-P3662]